MNRVNYVSGRTVEAADLNAVQATMESHLRSHAQKLLAGQIVGLAVSGTATGLEVAPGFTWDAQGRRIALASATAVDVSGVQRPASGQYQWLLVYASYATANRGTVQDITQAQQVAYIDDSFTLAIASGPAFAAADIGDARGTAAGRPATPEGGVGLGLLILDHGTSWDPLGAAAVALSQPSQPSQPSVATPWEPGDIRPWPGAVIPTSWAVCDGAAVSRAENPGAFAALGTVWGAGDGRTTFNLPNLIGRSLFGAGRTYRLGAYGGLARVALGVDQIPAHSHTYDRPEYSSETQINWRGGTIDRTVRTAGRSTGAAGGGQPHENIPPYAVVNWIIRLG